MGLFDRFLPLGRAIAGASKDDAVTPEQEALRLIDEGSAIEQEGRLPEALQRYETAVQLAPNLARAHLNRGNMLLEMGDADGALAAYATALLKNPDYAAAHYNTGNAYARSGRSEAALDCYRRALALNPAFADAEVALGSALEDLGRLDDAVASYQRALTIKPDYAEVHANLGLSLKKLGRLDDAVASYRRALALSPDRAEAHIGLGDALHDLGQLDDAVASYRRALQLRPDNALAHNNLGRALDACGESQEAIANFQRALEIDSGVAAVHFNLGNAQQAMGQYHAASESFRRALEIDPADSDAHCILGTALHAMGLLHDALACFRRALELNPDLVAAHNNLGNLLTDLGQGHAAVASYREALRINPDYSSAQSNLLFSLNYRADQGTTTLLAEARRYGDLVARQARPFTVWHNSPDPARRLRVGFVSGDLRNHVVGHFAEGVLAALASTADRPEIFAYSNHFSTDEVARRIKASCDRWHLAVGHSDEGLAHRIHDDQIDILVDLSGHSALNRLPVFAWKPAPVQATWLGYFATTGVAAIDYLIADPWTLPATEEVNFTEKIWRLPETRLCFTKPEVELEVAPLPALRNACITFGSLNRLAKMNDDVVALWAKVLRAVPASRLLLKSVELEETSVRQDVIERFAAHGVAADRLVLEGKESFSGYLAAHHRVDIALDPFPYTGGATSVHALWMGVPVLTLAGMTFLSRQGVGLLMNAGLPEWVAVDTHDYVARAAAHARDLPRLALLRRGLRKQVLATPVFDNARFAGHLATALRGMWQERCRRQPDRST